MPNTAGRPAPDWFLSDDGSGAEWRKALFVPSPDEIAAACAEIRATWSDDVLKKRAVVENEPVEFQPTSLNAAIDGL